jgi:NADH dehydrogenase
MTVLVTGSSGVLGTRVLERLRTVSRTRALVHRHPVAAADEIVSGDLLSGAGVDVALEGVETVVHLAAITHARRASAYERLNVGGTQVLVDAAARFGVARFVHVSTRAIDTRGGAYSVSKARAEATVRAGSVPWVILRLAEVYGGTSGEGVDELIDRARAGRSLLIVGRGEHEVCPLHVDDAADAIVAAVTRDGITGRTYTVGGECTTLRAFADECAKAFGGRSRVVGVPERVASIASHVARLVPLPLVPDQLDRLRAPKERPSDAARADLGFTPRPLAEGLVDAKRRW